MFWDDRTCTLSYLSLSMEFVSIYSLLTLGFSLGLLHALDADHIMAVSSLASANNGGDRRRLVRRMLGYCCRWAFGHGAIILSLGLLFILTRIELPASAALLAEKLVSVVLITLGGWIFWQVCRNRLTLRAHHHGDVTHMHLSGPGRQHHHRPILIGATHGLAGSAPVLALIPVAGSAPVGAGMLAGVMYIVLFCLGVLVSMLVFGLFFGQLQNWIAGFGQKLFHASRLLIASASIGVGAYWLLH